VVALGGTSPGVNGPVAGAQTEVLVLLGGAEDFAGKGVGGLGLVDG
jgi:hypothetical protein